MKLNFKSILNIFLIYSFLLLIWSFVLVFLPKTPVECVFFEKPLNFYSIDLTNLFFNQKLIKKRVSKPKPAIVANIKDFRLKALYGAGNSGFIIIEDRGKTVFIDINQVYKGFKLVKINMDSAVFVKNGKKYIISFKNEKIKGKSSENKSVNNRNFISQRDYVKHPVKKLQRKLINYFAKKYDYIWQNIGIVKTEKGYKITFIKPGSIFYKMGLRKNDIILFINNIPLKSDADAWNIYKNRNKFDVFVVKILRNNKEKVLRYEIY